MLDTGACRFGVADAEEVEPEAEALYRRWTAAGHHGSMNYLEKYPDIRRDPRLLLEGARSIICSAFSYFDPSVAAGDTAIAQYALGDDYHEVVRERLEKAAARIRDIYGGSTRVCVDTAPLRERYWAARCGVGVIGLNNHLIVPGAGSYVFLGEIITTVRFRPTQPLAGGTCHRCGRCVEACPAGALTPDGACDASRCLSYLTIEHRGPLPDGTRLHGHLYGCDVCAGVCPYNAAPKPATIPEFVPRPEVTAITADRVLTMTQPEFSATFRRSAIKRAKLAGLRRNAEALEAEKRAGYPK